MKKLLLLFLLIPAVSSRDLSDSDMSPDARYALSLEADSWKHAETAHFVYHFLDAKEAETVYVHAEPQYEWIKNFLGVAEDRWKKKSHVFVFSDDQTWRRFNENVRHGRFEAGGFTNGWELFIKREPFWLSPQKVLAHELTHLILFRFLDGPIPLFLNEGFAEFASYRAISVQFDGNEYRVHSIEKIPEEKFIELKNFTSMKDYPEDQVEIFYQQSELLVRFLTHSPRDQKRFYELLRQVSGGKNFETALGDVYETDYETFAAKFKAFALSKALA